MTGTVEVSKVIMRKVAYLGERAVNENAGMKSRIPDGDDQKIDLHGKTGWGLARVGKLVNHVAAAI
jgi:hypothetical protein